ncbi:MAG: DNA-protecting protein DprA [Deltaproteobacteria bacterium]|nr:DNA-protecting protein DprA [Deltaproteobacteria bacterium]
MAESFEIRVALALRHVPGLGPRTWKRLLERYKTFAAVWEARNSWVADGVVREWQVRRLGEDEWKRNAERELANAVRLECAVILYTDREYPDRLREIPDPPVLVYTIGDASLLSRPCLAVVGSRQCGPYGLEACSLFSKKLAASGLTIVSGFAAGIDSEAHKAGLAEVGSSIAVLGTGPDVVYPASNRELWKILTAKGLIVTEFAPRTKPEAKNFPHRNRIISGLSLGVLIVEGAVKSGSLVTARLGLEQNREVFALPGPVTSGNHAGCHALIRQGALLVQTPEDILHELAPILEAEWVSEDRPCSAEGGLEFNADSSPELDVFERLEAKLNGDNWMVVRQFRDLARPHIDELARRSGLDSATVSRILICLEMDGLVRRLPGMHYELGPEA